MKVEVNYKKKNGKKHKHVETKQHTSKQPIGQRKRSKRKTRTSLRQIKMKTTLQYLWDATKTV